MTTTIESFQQALDLAKSRRRISVSVAAAHDLAVLQSIHAASQEGIVFPYLIGDKFDIEHMMKSLGMKAQEAEVIPANSDEEAAYLAAQLAHQGIADCVMKGLLNSTTFLKGILNKDFELRQGVLLSHVSIFEIPGFPRLLYVTDGGLNVTPDLEQKHAILLNAVRFLQRLGVATPKVALLAANEKVMTGMPTTLDAQVLTERARTGDFGSVLMDGPLPLDLAISPDAAAHKRVQSAIGGEADVLFAPTIEVGNTLGKAITYFGGGTMAGIVLGAKVPLVLTSRADSFEAKLASLAFSVLESTETSHQLQGGR